MNNGTGSALTDVAGYAAAVRRHLIGLSSEQVEDLTDGLEADLADALADGDQPAGADLGARFGDPAVYAAELRAAAGLEPPTSVTGAGAWRRFGTWLATPVRGAERLGRQALVALRRTSWWAPVERLLVECRPLWWALRAWVVFQVLVRVLGADSSLGWVPRDFGELVVLAALLVVSVQWGRGVWRRVPWVRGAGRAVSVTVLVLLLPMLAVAHAGAVAVEWYDSGSGVQYVYQDKPMDGVVVDGMQVSNLFVYDADGNPLQDVQIFDDRGREVRTTYDDGAGDWSLPGVDVPWAFAPATDEDGRSRWNVYPLQGAPSEDFTWGDTGERELIDGASLRRPPRPFAKAPVIVAPGSTGEQGVPQPEPSSSGAPGAAQSPGTEPTAGETAVP
ncbi:HAAS signaling domain-containing protein [Cellulomonas hominis]